MKSDLTKLKTLLLDLNHYASPSNRDGFLIPFCRWTLNEWNNRAYFRSERSTSTLDFSNFPIRTDFLLKEKAKYYRDFINSKNGRHYASFLSGHESSCETLEKNFYEYFHESMRLHALSTFATRYPDLDAEDFWDRIFCETFEDVEERSVAEEIAIRFGFYGMAAEPYTCPVHSKSYTGGGRFAKWLQEDFKRLLTLIENDWVEFHSQPLPSF